MEIKADKIAKILKKYGYNLVFDKIHSDSELKKYSSKEPNFDKHKYLTIKTKDNIIVGRIYTKNSPFPIPLSKISLNEEELSKIIAFFKFFKIENYKKIIEEIKKLTGIEPEPIQADIIRNNVYQRKSAEY